MMVPSTSKLAGQGKVTGEGGAPWPLSVEGPKAMGVAVRVQGPGNGGTGHHDDRGSGGVGRQRCATRRL
jgi:hypothetical protein